MALALVLGNHLPTPQADVLLVMTYVVVVFCIMVQGLSMKRPAPRASTSP